MIRVTVELMSARTGEQSIIGIMDICNTGKREFGSARGDYHGRIYHRVCKARITREGEVLEFPRHSYVIWHLILRMLKSMYPEEK